MKKILVFILLLTAVQVNADAQFFKKLGKALEDAAKSVVEGSSSESRSSSSNQSSTMSAEQMAKQTGFTIALTSAIRAEEYGFLTFTLTNNTSEDKSVTLGTYETYSGEKNIILPDGTILKYEMKWGGKWQDNLIPDRLELPAGIPVKVFVMVDLRKDNVTTLGRVRLTINDKINYNFNNVELAPADNSDSKNVTVNSKDVKVDFLSCVRDGKNLIIKIKVTPKEDLHMQFSEHTTGNCLYDIDGNMYKDIRAKVGNGLAEYDYEAGLPINGTITVYNVPTNQNKFARLQYVFETGDYYPYTIKIKNFQAEAAQSATNAPNKQNKENKETAVQIGKGDLAAFDVHGNVKQLTTTEDGKQMVRTFDANGKWISCNGLTLAKYYPAGIKRDAKGRIVEGHPDLSEKDWVHRYKYNSKGQLIELELSQDYFTRTLYYTYDASGNMLSVREPIPVEPGDEEGKPSEAINKFQIITTDSHGNWTERKVDGKSIERRKILYY